MIYNDIIVYSFATFLLCTFQKCSQMHGLPGGEGGEGEGEGENKGTHVSLRLSAGSSVIKAMYKEHVKTQHIAQGLDYIYMHL